MIHREDVEGITVLRLCHGKASALDVELLRALASEIDATRGDRARALVLTGTGSIFSAGVDLYRIVEGGLEYVDDFLPELSRVLRLLFEHPHPMVAALNGHAIAGGAILAQCADRRLMADGSGRIGFPELLVGVPFPPLAMEILRFAIPTPSLQQLMMSGATVRSTEALQFGMIDAVEPAEALLDTAMETASRLAAIPAETFAATKALLRQSAMDRYERLGRAAETETSRIWRSPEARDRIRLYLEQTVEKKQRQA